MEILILGAPFVVTIASISLFFCSTVAISPNLIVPPVGKINGRFLISSTSSNLPTVLIDNS